MLIKPKYVTNKDLYKIYALAHIVSKILLKHKINYRADAGTLLGIIRHKGNAIPWDDDVDLVVKECDIDKIINLAPYFNKKGLMITVKYDEPLGEGKKNRQIDLRRLQISFINNCKNVKDEFKLYKCYNQGVSLPFLDIIPIREKYNYYTFSLNWMLKDYPNAKFSKKFFDKRYSKLAKFGPTKLLISKNHEENIKTLINQYGKNYNKTAIAPIIHHGSTSINFNPIPLDMPNKYDYSSLFQDNLTTAQKHKYKKLINYDTNKLKKPIFIRFYLDNKEFKHPIYNKTRYTKLKCKTKRKRRNKGRQKSRKIRNA